MSTAISENSIIDNAVISDIAYAVNELFDIFGNPHIFRFGLGLNFELD